MQPGREKWRGVLRSPPSMIHRQRMRPEVIVIKLFGTNQSKQMPTIDLKSYRSHGILSINTFVAGLWDILDSFEEREAQMIMKKISS